MGPPGYPAQGLRQEAIAPGDPGLPPCGLQAWEKLWSWTAPGGRGIAASDLDAVARDERPGVGLLADGQAGGGVGWGEGR